MRTKDSTAKITFTTKTAAGLRAAIMEPASIGPTTRLRFMEMPFSASAAGKSLRGTTLGTMAANTGQRTSM